MGIVNEPAASAATGAIEHAAGIVAAFVSKNPLPAGELPGLIASVHRMVTALGNGIEAPPLAVAPEPAVPVKKSVTHNHIICLDDGKKFRSMRRHLAVLGMTPDEYRAKWRLPGDYPMVAAAYSEKRSELAKSIGLGRPQLAAKARTADPVKRAPVMKAKRQGRPRKAA